MRMRFHPDLHVWALPLNVFFIRYGVRLGEGWALYLRVLCLNVEIERD